MFSYISFVGMRDAISTRYLTESAASNAAVTAITYSYSDCRWKLWVRRPSVGDGWMGRSRKGRVSRWRI